MHSKDCPMCGEPMRLTERESTDRVPGTQQYTVTTVREWVCPDCEFFEEADALDR